MKAHTIPALLLLLLLAVPLAAQDSQAAPRRLRDLEQRLAQEKRTWSEARAAAASQAERDELRAAFPLAEFLGELEALAAEAGKSDVAARAWLEVYRLACLLEEHALFQHAIERLLTDCLASPEMNGFTLELAYGAPPWGRAQAAEALRRILSGSQDTNVQASAMVQLALLIGQDEAAGEAGRAEARVLLERIRAEHGERDFLGMSGNQFVDGALFELEQLRLGQVAPDFRLKDQDGIEFALSDYRGRVVLLDFWGFV